MIKDINGAGFDPRVEDVPLDLSEDEELCELCNGPLHNYYTLLITKYVGDELYFICDDCEHVQH